MPANTLYRPNKFALVRCDVQAMPENQAKMKTTKELRELDAWIGVNVFDKKAIHRDGPQPDKGEDCFVVEYINISVSLPRYTTDPAAAMLVLKEVSKKRTADGYDQYRPDATLCISAPYPDWDNEWVIMSDPCGEIIASGPTFEIAICRFAKSLFSKT